MNDRSVYICYSRSHSAALALALFHTLRARNCDVFIDAGDFDCRDVLDLAQIEARAHFLVLLAPGLIETFQKRGRSAAPRSRSGDAQTAQRRAAADQRLQLQRYVCGAGDRHTAALLCAAARAGNAGADGDADRGAPQPAHLRRVDADPTGAAGHRAAAHRRSGAPADPRRGRAARGSHLQSGAGAQLVRITPESSAT